MWEDKHASPLYIAVCSGLGCQHTKGANSSRYQSIYEPTEPSQPVMRDNVNDEERPQHRPYSFQIVCGSFNVPQSYMYMWTRFVRQDLWFYSPYPRRLESIIICRCHYKDSTFSSVILRPWVLVQPGFKLTTSCSADRRSPNWANWVVATSRFQCITVTSLYLILTWYSATPFAEQY